MSSPYGQYVKHGGWWRRRPSMGAAIKVFLTATALLTGILFVSVGIAKTRTAQVSQEPPALCRKINNSAFDCTAPDIRAKADKVTEWYAIEKTKTIKAASVSAYTLHESCHNRIGGHCLNAAGKEPREGHSIACPRSVKLGAKAFIKGSSRQGNYICDDRTAEWIERKYGPTFDIFLNDPNEAVRFGRQTLEVTIYEQPTQSDH